MPHTDEERKQWLETQLGPRYDWLTAKPYWRTLTDGVMDGASDAAIQRALSLHHAQ